MQTQNEHLGLSVMVRVMSLASPRSEEQLKSELLAHVLDCHECLAAVLFQEESLDQVGCAEYQKMFVAATEELSRQTPLDPGAHLPDELVEAFALDTLSEEQMIAMAQHVENCDNCRHRLAERQTLALSLKSVVEERRQGGTDHGKISGILGLHVPDENWHLIWRLNS